VRSQLAVAVLFVLTAGSASSAQAQAGAADYKSKCMMCHGADGTGNTPAGKSMSVPSFSSPDVVKASDADLIAATANGKGKMPAYSGKLTGAQIKDVVAYIRTMQK
jgi:mono/diheme cytochrome c family protein